MKLICLASALAFALLLVPSLAPAEDAPASAITRGNGEKNWILVDGVTRAGRTFTFKEVHLEAGGWLVLHPFEDGKPRGEIYVGARYLPAGTHANVTVDVQTAPEPATGTPFIAMLHSDTDDDQTFDFVFVDGGPHVEDKALIEGTTMVAHEIQAP